MSTLDLAVALAKELIAFPTISSDSNLALIAHCAERLETHGATTVVTRDPTGTKANVFATIGPPVDGGVVLSGHTDVVPVEGQDWSTDPFTPVLRDARLHGRGACDMKGFIACALAMAPRFAAAKLERPIHFAFTYDEEIGCLGAPVLLAELARTGPLPSVAIVGEPTAMRVIEGHKGCYEYTTEIRGLEGHASAPAKGVNAIEYAVRYGARLLEIADSLRDEAPPASPFDPPEATISIGKIDGGIARNVIPRDCRFEWEVRPVRRADAARVTEDIDRYARETLLPRMRAMHPEASLVTHTIGAVDGLEPMPESEAIRLAESLTGANTREVVSFGTEAGLFQSAGISTVVCGPGSIDQAHRPDEFVEIDQLGACLAMLERLVAKLE